VARGVVWGTGPNPTLANNFTVDGAGLGSFTSALSDLPASTAFFVRAYATNSAGTAYGGAYQITTSVATVAGVTTDQVNGVTVNAATATGTVSHQGGATVTERGFCWSTSPDPTLQNNQGFVTAGSGLGGFAGNLGGLTGNTTYYVRAFGTNSAGTQYGSQLQFTTSPVPPVVSTAVVSNIGALTAMCGGNVSATGGLAVTQYGVCWSTSPNPSTADNITFDGIGTGNFSSSLLGLQPSTTYYVRAYAVNGAGTAYGNQVQFTTTNGIPQVSTTAVSAITAATVVTGGIISTDGGDPITTRGVCWSTSPNPTTANNSTSDGSGLGVYASNISGLISGNTYYVRSYAVNGAGTAYGNQVQFTAMGEYLNPNLTYGSVTDQNGITYATIVIGTQEWMAENLRTTTYANGDTIPNVTEDNQWGNEQGTPTTGAWAHYGNNSSSEYPYGKLYNGYAAADPRNVCPTNWHVPTDAEWNTLIGYLDPGHNPGAENAVQSSTAGGMMKSTGTQYWLTPNTGATDVSGFSAVPSGGRDGFTGDFQGLGGGELWWTASETDMFNAWRRGLDNTSEVIFRGSTYKRYGLSVRCLRD
jgi:uncharacterized protein (TIGR02145 family)